MVTHTSQELSAICQAIEQTISADQIYLFGSHAYGTPNADSDYDLCVVIPDGSMRPADAIKRIRRALFPVQTTPLDVIVYQASAFQDRQKSASLERQIAQEGVLLYERSDPRQRVV